MFISIEGGEGSGKTTQIKKICEYFDSKGLDYLATREPGEGFLGKQIRSILLNPKNEMIVPKAELLLFMADRAQHLETVILPALKLKKIILCDRFFDSTAVYQGIVGELGLERVSFFHRVIFDDIKPDVTFLLDVSPEVGLSRTQCQLDKDERAENESRFEKKKLVFHKKIQAGFLKIAGDDFNKTRFRVIDAEVKGSLVWANIKKYLDKFF